MAPSLRMRNGFYCVLPLRTCTIILVCINLLISASGLLLSEFMIHSEVAHPRETLLDEFDMEEDGSGEAPASHGGQPGGGPEEAGEAHSRDHARYSRFIIVTSLVVNAVNLVLSVADIVLSFLLLYGAATRKSAFIRPWLYCGATMMVYDVLYFLVLTEMGIYFGYVGDALLHIPLVAYLWLVAWNLAAECRDAEQRVAAAAAPMSMAALTAGGGGPGSAGSADDEEACSVPYHALEEG